MPRAQVTVWRVGLAAFSGVLYGACFAPLDLWQLAFVALAPLVLAARNAGVRRGCLLGWVAGTVTTTIVSTPVLTVGALAYFPHGVVAAWMFATLLGQVFFALPTALFGATVARVSRLRPVPLRILVTAAVWVGLEFVRAHGITGTGSPWALLAHSLYRAPLWIQVADLGGTFAVSFVLVTTAAALAEVRTAPRGAIATAALALGLTAAYGAWRLARESDQGPTIRLALVQSNLPNALRADPARAGEALRALVDTTASVLPTRPALVIWPENAVGLLPDSNAWIAARLRETLGADGPPLLLGAPRAAQEEPGKVHFFNSAYLLAPTGETLGIYDKRRLVPFAEYMPVVAGLGRRFVAPGDYTAGAAPTIFTTPVPFGVLICFEGIYGDLARDLVQRGAQLLVNISNDAWFDGSAGVEEAFAMTTFRAVESRRALVRVANTGVTGVVGPSGRVLARFPIGVRGAWDIAVPLRAGTGSPYDRFGDAFAWLALAVAALAAWRAP